MVCNPLWLARFFVNVDALGGAEVPQGFADLKNLNIAAWLDILTRHLRLLATPAQLQ